MPWLVFKHAFNFEDLRESPPQLKLAWILSFIAFFFSPIIMVVATLELVNVEQIGDFKCEDKLHRIALNIDGCNLPDGMYLPTEDEQHHIREIADAGWPILLFSMLSIMFSFGGLMLTKATHTVHYVWWTFFTLILSIFLLVGAIFVHKEVSDLHSFCDHTAVYAADVPSDRPCEQVYTGAFKDVLRHCKEENEELARKYHAITELSWFTHGDLYCVPEESDWHGCNCHCLETTQLTCENLRREATLLNVFVWIAALGMLLGSIAAAASPRGTVVEDYDAGGAKVSRQPLSRKATRSRLGKSTSRGLDKSASRGVPMA